MKLNKKNNIFLNNIIDKQNYMNFKTKNLRTSIYNTGKINNYQIQYYKITKLLFIILLSEYLSNFLKNFIISSKIKINIKLVYKLENNINIFGKYLSKELIYNPRQFKNLFKKYIKND